MERELGTADGDALVPGVGWDVDLFEATLARNPAVEDLGRTEAVEGCVLGYPALDWPAESS